MSASADDEGLSTQQREKLRTFQEIASGGGHPDHFDQARALQVLKSCNWSLEQAVQLYLATVDEEAGLGASGPSLGGLRSPRGLDTPLLDAATMRDAQAARGPGASGSGSGGGSAPAVSRSAGAENGLMGWISRGLRRISNFGLCLVRAFVFGANRAGLGGHLADAGGERLRQALISEYGPDLALPRFFEGSFQEAIAEARRELKLFVVYLHSPISPHAESFCRGVLGNDLVRSMLDDSFLLWCGDISHGETQAAALSIGAMETPCLIVLLPASPDDMRVLERITADTQTDQAGARLVSCLDHMDSHRAELVARAEQHAEDRMLRDQQDREYREALEVDRVRIEEERRQADERRAAEEEAQQQEVERQQTLQLQEAERQQKLEVLQARGQALGPPPPEATSSISLRLPAGQRIQRKFAPSATLEQVYEWAELSPFLPENAGKGLVMPERFVLKAAFPSKNLVEREQTVEALQLAGSNLLIAALDADDEVEGEGDGSRV